MRKSIFTLFCTVGVTLSQLAFADVRLRPDAPELYEIRPGDSLLSLSARYVENPGEWEKLWNGGEANIHNPHTLYPGQTLVLKRTGGKPNLSVLGGSTNTVVKLMPGVNDVTNGYAIPTLPIDFLKGFMSYPRILDEKTIQNDPEIINAEGNRLMYMVGDTIYAKRLPSEGRYIIYHPEAKIYDPENNRYLGYEVSFVGEAFTMKARSGRTVDRADGTLPSRSQYQDGNERMHELHPFLKTKTTIARPLQITTTVDTIKLGDKLMFVPEKTYERFNFMPHNAKTNVRGKVLKVYRGLRTASNYQTIAINRGSTHGIDKGTILTVYSKLPSDYGNRSRNGLTELRRVEYPARKVAHIIIYEVAPSLSYGLVFGGDRQLTVGDIVSNVDQDLSDFNMPPEHVPNWILDIYDEEGNNAQPIIDAEKSRRALQATAGKGPRQQMQMAPRGKDYNRQRYDRVKQKYKSGAIPSSSIQNKNNNP